MDTIQFNSRTYVSLVDISTTERVDRSNLNKWFKIHYPDCIFKLGRCLFIDVRAYDVWRVRASYAIMGKELPEIEA